MTRRIPRYNNSYLRTDFQIQQQYPHEMRSTNEDRRQNIKAYFENVHLQSQSKKTVVVTMNAQKLLGYLFTTSLAEYIQNHQIVTQNGDKNYYMQVYAQQQHQAQIINFLGKQKISIFWEQFIVEQIIPHKLFMLNLCIIQDQIAFCQHQLDDNPENQPIPYFDLHQSPNKQNTMISVGRTLIPDTIPIKNITCFFMFFGRDKNKQKIVGLLKYCKEKVDCILLQNFSQNKINCYCIQTFYYYHSLLVLKKSQELNLYGYFIQEQQTKTMHKILNLRKSKDKQQSTNLTQIKTLNKILHDKDIAQLVLHLSNQNSLQDLHFILDNWNIYRPTFEQPLREFQDYLQFRIVTLNRHKNMFPSIFALQQKLQRVNDRVGKIQDAKRSGCVDNPTDTYLSKYIRELSSSAQSLDKNGHETTQNKMSLANQIANFEQYSKIKFSTLLLQNILARIKHNFTLKEEEKAEEELEEEKSSYSRYKLKPEQIKQNQKIVKEKTFRNNFSNNIEKERLVQMQYLCCSSFFYTQTNICDPFVNKTPLLTMGPLKQISNQVKNLKDKVCYLMNNGGGVILFDCQRKYRQVLPIGSQFTSFDYQNEPQRIYHILEAIQPKLQIGVNLQISLVPVIPNPLKNQILSDQLQTKLHATYQQKYYPRQYQKGMFVLRIKVKPTQSWRTYYWTQDKKINIPEKINETQFRPVEGSRIHQIMTQKMNKFYISQQLTDDQRSQKQLFTPPSSCFHQGRCINPDSGHFLFSNSMKQQEKQQVSQKYLNMSMIICKKTDHPKVIQSLRQKNISCSIVELFPTQRFKAAKNTAILYHNQRFDKLLKIISKNPTFTYANKQTSIICVTQCIKFPNHSSKNYLSYQQFVNFQKNWLNRFYDKQYLQYYKYINEKGQQQFYMQTGGRQSTILMYYVLNQYNHKCTFKNPKNFDKGQIKGKMELIYPLKQSFQNDIQSSYLEQKNSGDQYSSKQHEEDNIWENDQQDWNNWIIYPSQSEDQEQE